MPDFACLYGLFLVSPEVGNFTDVILTKVKARILENVNFSCFLQFLNTELCLFRGSVEASWGSLGGLWRVTRGAFGGVLGLSSGVLRVHGGLLGMS